MSDDSGIGRDSIDQENIAVDASVNCEATTEEDSDQFRYNNDDDVRPRRRIRRRRAKPEIKEEVVSSDDEESVASSGPSRTRPGGGRILQGFKSSSEDESREASDAIISDNEEPIQTINRSSLPTAIDRDTVDQSGKYYSTLFYMAN